MKKLENSIRRHNKIQNSRKHGVSGRSVFIIRDIQEKRAQKIKSKKRQQERKQKSPS